MEDIWKWKTNGRNGKHIHVCVCINYMCVYNLHEAGGGGFLPTEIPGEMKS